MSNKKGMAALHSVSDNVVAALRTLTDVPHIVSDRTSSEIAAREPGFPSGGALTDRQLEELYPDDGGDPDVPAEQSKPVDRAAPTAPSLYVPGAEAILAAGDATNSERVREYGLLAEIEAKLTSTGDDLEQVKTVIAATQQTLEAAHTRETETFKAWTELEKQRQETVDRIVKLNQTAIDHEAARLRRGS